MLKSMHFENEYKKQSLTFTYCQRYDYWNFVTYIVHQPRRYISEYYCFECLLIIEFKMEMCMNKLIIIR